MEIRGGKGKFQTRGSRRWNTEFLKRLEDHLREKYPKYKCCKCGKQLVPGDEAADRWGQLYCHDCNEKYPPPFMAVYQIGVLK